MNTVTIEGFSRDECAVLMAMKGIENCISAGVITGCSFKLSDSGRASCEELDRAGFEFNDGELQRALAGIIAGVRELAMEDNP